MAWVTLHRTNSEVKIYNILNKRYDYEFLYKNKIRFRSSSWFSCQEVEASKELRLFLEMIGAPLQKLFWNICTHLGSK